MKFYTFFLKGYNIQRQPVRQVPPFDWLTIVTPLVSGESTLLHQLVLCILVYTFWSSIENFSAYCQVLPGSILLPPRHPHVFARMARWQLGNVDWFAIFTGIMGFSAPSIMRVGTVLMQITRQRVHSPNFTRLRCLKSVPFKWVYCNTMRHIPQEDKYLIIYKRLQSFICRMLLIQPGLYFFILRNRLLIETFLGTDVS